MPRKPPADDETHVLNVDLEVRSSKKLTPLATAMEQLGAHVLANLLVDKGVYLASFELEVSPRGRMLRTADAKARRLVDLVNALPAAARSLFDAAARRTFDIGIQAERKPTAFALALSPSTVKRIAALNAEIAVTVYAVDRPAVPPKNVGLQLAVQRRLNAKR